MKPKAPKRKATKFVLRTCPHCGNEGYYCDDIESTYTVKRKPLPKKLRVATKLWISELAQVNGCEESVYILKELLRRAGGE